MSQLNSRGASKEATMNNQTNNLPRAAVKSSMKGSYYDNNGGSSEEIPNMANYQPYEEMTPKRSASQPGYEDCQMPFKRLNSLQKSTLKNNESIQELCKVAYRDSRKRLGNKNGPKMKQFGSGKGKTLKQKRIDHCQICTQCDYWMQKIQIYQSKIDKHIDQQYGSGVMTANFNSLANINHYLNGTVASFGRQSLSIPLPKRAVSSQSKGVSKKNTKAAVNRRQLLQKV